ncbi:MAG: ABC transporter ATP-binding protein [Candidatus Altiarchaeota archaeon]|nr:ABC transporter ATP-binding protein [Candidatus Altiarchaeota archaeon]MBU4342186.1 ABC transporter ATP-binding protein [Candidatus Altiarchaeota archaeon]MBU4406553.1 ABC transporter ATP-binding protein [Candidatus Altiarchaeota archaeon]MBU4437324.1 ABC transporter ATP-binding protein [Candidatus Altiarchaeota archaeon]
MSLIRFDSVSKTYEEGDDIVQALDSADFEIDEGNFVAIMGPSGSGKSTMLTLLGILNTPTDGDIFIDDIAVYDLKPEKQADFRSEYLGFVFQAFQLIPYLTAMENVMLPLSITKMSNKEQEKRAKGALERVGLADKINRLPNQISGGETQRVAISRAIVNEPPILLADEPTGNLDSKNAIGVMNLLKELNDEGETIIMVTHDKKTAEYADYTIELKDGRIVSKK